MMPQGQHVEHNIRLKPLQTIEGNHTRSTRNSFATSNLSLVGTSPNEGRIAPSSERLLATRAIRSNGHNEDFNRRQSLSQRSLDIDLEASLTPVQLDSETRQNDENAIDISKIQAKKAQHSKFNTASIQSVLLRAITFLYKTSCRVVDVSNNEDVSKMHEKTDSLVINSSTASISTFETPSVSSHTVESSYCQNAPRPDEHFLAIVVRKTLYCKWTQPFILFLIMLQTVLLLVETTGQGAYNGQRIFSSSTLWRNVCYLVIFFLYTAELACKGAVHWLERGEATPIESRLSLRNLFNTLDVVAVVSFWINLIIRLALPHQIRLSQVLAMLSGLRILRLLRVTAGTDSESTVIFEALKESGARLAKVASFICFFWLIFAVVGIQMFKSSLKRSCVLVNTDPIAVKTAPLEEIQFCGGHLAASVWNEPHSWIKSDGSPGAVGHRGYLCPRGMVCQEGTNPYNDTVSFDNIFQSLELVFVIFSANTFSTLMYSVMDSNGLAAALFFAVVIVVLYFWLVILLVGVITGSIQEIRQRLRIPATAQDRRSIQSGGQPKTPKSGPGQGTTASVRKAFRKTKWFWIMIIAYNLVAQAQRVSGMSVTTEAFIDYSESVVTWILLLEIILRFALDWRTFHHSKQNLADLGLAIVTSIMQVPFVQKSGRVFTWLKAFQVSRSYRIFWAINPVRDIIVSFPFSEKPEIAYEFRRWYHSTTFRAFCSSLASFFFLSCWLRCWRLKCSRILL
jgi:hypothetical protein